jgi:hypothetical protein
MDCCLIDRVKTRTDLALTGADTDPDSDSDFEDNTVQRTARRLA